MPVWRTCIVGREKDDGWNDPWSVAFCGVAHAYFYVLCACHVGIFVGWGNLFPDWYFAWFIPLVHVEKNGRGHKDDS